MGKAQKREILLTGMPGIGKTTIIRKLAAALGAGNVRGFFTEEVRVAGRRRGFRVVTLDGREGRLADVDFRSPHRVSKYGVDVAGFESLALPVLAGAERDPTAIFLIDEIGKMECFSDAFVRATRELFDRGSTVVATVARRGGGFIAEMKHRPDVEILEVTRANRDTLHTQIVDRLRDPE